MLIARIDNQLTPNVTSHLVRLGDDFDGGYVIDKRSVEAADLMIALGVGDSWGFEADCLKLKPMPLEAYDGTVGSGYYVSEFAKSLVVFFNHKFVRRRWAIMRGYFDFFKADRHHHSKLVGMNQPPDFLSLEEVFKAHGVGPDKKVFLKIDIEGWEYRLLDTLIAYRKHITGLAIEFHDFDLHQDRVVKFAKDFGLNIAHIHCNNCAPIAADGTPLVIEMSFTAAAADKKPVVVLPHPLLDMPNEKKREDYKIELV